MKKLIPLLLYFICISFVIKSQSGGLYMSDFKLLNKGEKWCWALSQDNERSMLIGVAQGIVVFDGINQTLVKTPFFPTQIKYDQQSNLAWVSGYEHFGKLYKNKQGNYVFELLKFKDEYDFKDIVLLEDTVCFVSEISIIRYTRESNEFIDETVSEEYPIEQVLVYKDELMVLIDYFLFKIEDGKFTELAYDFPVDVISYAITLPDDKILLGTAENVIYFFDESGYSTRRIKGEPFFENNVIVDGALYNDSMIILSSLAGGIALVDYNKRVVQRHISYFNGLPDEEIRSFFIDDMQGLWLSHQLGISRVDFNVNIQNYSHYPGLKGTPLAVSQFNNNIYVGTSDGLFKLSEIKSFNEFTVSINVPVDVVEEVPIEIDKKPQTVAANTKTKRKKSAFSFLSRKKAKNKADDVEEDHDKPQVEHVRTQKITKTQNQTRKIKKRSLKSISHQYVAVKGINDKCRSLVNFDNAMFVAGNNGLYVISESGAKKIISQTYIIDVYLCPEKDALYCCTNNGLYKVFKRGGRWTFDHYAESTDTYLNSVAYEGGNDWVLAFEDMVVRANIINGKLKINYSTDLPESSGMTFFLKRYNDSTFVFGGNNAYYFNENGALQKIEEFDIDTDIFNDQSNFVWIKKGKKWSYRNVSNKILNQSLLLKLKLFDAIRSIKVENTEILWLIDEQNQIVKINNDLLGKSLDFDLKVLELVANEDTLFTIGKIELPAKHTHISYKIGAPYFLKQEGVMFSYKLEGVDLSWSKPTTNSNIDIRYIPSGDYVLKIKAVNNLGLESEVLEIPVKVAKPFTHTFLFYLLLIAATLGAAYFVFKYRMQSLEKAKEILEQKVVERTKTIQEQKTKIEKQHDEITQSIRYAQRIQSAMLPNDEIIEAMIPQHFIMFMPRDIVSGDFYFFKPIKNKIVFVVADCTGHGVPGGFMSMLGISFLSEITSQLKDPSAAEVVNHLRDKIKLALGQDDYDSTQKDGMDLSITIIDTDKDEIQFAGAFNPLFIVRNNEIETVKADRQPVAVYVKESEFTNHVIKVQKDDVFYMFSDGFPDQIGGPKERKYMTKNFKKLLLDIHTKPMEEQKAILKKEIIAWKGETMQMDDILVAGYKLK